MSILRGIIGLVVIFALCYLMSSDKSKVKSKLTRILVMLVLMVALAYVCLKTTAGVKVLGAVSNFMSWLVSHAQEGVEFVFGGISNNGGVFLFNVLFPLVFMSALIGILDYIKVLPFIMKWVGILVNKLTGMGELESQFAIATTLFGQPTGYLTVTDQIKKISGKRMLTLCISAMSTVGASMLASYMEMVDGKYVVVAVILNIFSAFVITSIVNPYDIEEEKQNEIAQVENEEVEDEEKQNFFDMLSDKISSGWNLALSVAGTLVGFIAIIAFLNASLEAIVGVSFTDIMGYIFSPIAYAIGIPGEDVVSAGSIMATKLFTNEFAAMGAMESLLGSLSEKTVAMLSTYLISFANIGSIGITTGALKSIDEGQASYISKNSMKLLAASTLSSLLTATIVGFFY